MLYGSPLIQTANSPKAFFEFGIAELLLKKYNLHQITLSL
jgi:hypothetical protein